MQDYIKELPKSIGDTLSSLLLTLQHYIERLQKELPEEEILNRVTKIDEIITKIAMQRPNEDIITPKDYEFQLKSLERENDMAFREINELKNKIIFLERVEKEKSVQEEINLKNQDLIGNLKKRIKNDSDTYKYKEMLYLSKLKEMKDDEKNYESTIQEINNGINQMYKGNPFERKVFKNKSCTDFSFNKKKLKSIDQFKETMRKFNLYQKNKNVHRINNYIIRSNMNKIEFIVSQHNKNVVPKFEIKNKDKNFYSAFANE